LEGRSDDAPLFEGAGIAELHVTALPPAAAEAPLAHRSAGLSGRAKARILEQAAGNPLALIELPAAGADSPHSLFSDALPLTRKLQAVFARRLDSLSSPVRAVLLLCALEPSITLRELQQLGQADDVLLALWPAESLRPVSIAPNGPTVVTADTLRPLTGATYPLAEARQAFEDLLARRTTGKICCSPERAPYVDTVPLSALFLFIG
jgi:hypothetical protein